jgi:hypothetical protein
MLAHPRPDMRIPCLTCGLTGAVHHQRPDLAHDHGLVTGSFALTCMFWLYDERIRALNRAVGRRVSWYVRPVMTEPKSGSLR